MVKRNKKNNLPDETPLYCLNAFSEKATLTEFYIQNLKDHLQNHTFVSKPHKHDFYLILFIVRGEGTHTIDFNSYEVYPNAIFLMTPGQVHWWKLSDDTQGYIIFFTKAFYQMQMRESNLMEFPFYHSLTTSPAMKIEKDEVINFTFAQMLREYTSIDKPNLRLLRTYLDLLLLELARNNKSENTATQGNTIKLRKVEQLIEKNFKTLKQPGDYGNLMNLSTSYLNNICKDNLGKTLTALIQERIILEAKRLFAYSDMNVNEIAAKLNYDNASYFVRLFKKNTGITPEEFKRSLSVVM
jgi:AraC family transcriptional activator of pobA